MVLWIPDILSKSIASSVFAYNQELEYFYSINLLTLFASCNWESRKCLELVVLSFHLLSH